MYRLRFFLLLTLLFSFAAGAQVFDFQWQNPKPTGADFNEAIFISPSNYLLFGNGGTVCRSQDGGATWAVISLDTAARNLNSAHFPTAAIGYACGTGGAIFKTTNGGAQWTEQPSGVTTTLYGIYFTSPDTGFAAGASGALLKTVNGGGTWVNAAFGTSTNYTFNFLNSSTGFMGSSSSTTGRLIKTTDGGGTWTDVSTLLSGNTGSVRSIWFRDQSTGWLSTSSGLIFKTTDSGVSWTQAFSLGSTTTTIYKVAFGDPSNGLAVTTLGRILRTVDGGANWLTYQSSTQKALYGLAVSGSEAIVVGDAGNIYKTSDFGASFTKLTNAASQEQLQRGSFVSASTGYVVGGSISSGNSFGDVLKTTNGGNTWTRLPITPSTRVYSVCFLDENTGYIGVDGPSGMYKTTDGGQNWAQINTGTGVSGNPVYDIDFMNSSTGFAAYGSGQIAKTTDGGASWFPITAGFGAAACYDIFVVNTNVVYALGPGGRISKSTDSGVNFLQLPTLGTATLYSMHFFSPDTGYLVGSSGKIWKTVDGFSFTELQSPVTATIYVIRFVNRQVGWFGDSGGNVYYTVDGGISWIKSRIQIGSSQSTRDIQVRDGSLWVIGTDGMIMKGYSDPNVPVELTAFTASVIGTDVVLNWTTSTETNNSGFEVEKLRVDTWERIGFIKGNGTAAYKNSYSYTDKMAGNGTILYRLKQVDLDGSYTHSDIVEVNISADSKYTLEQNYPNPFGGAIHVDNPSTKIKFRIPGDVNKGVGVMVSLKVFDLLGREVSTLVNEIRPPGNYEVNFSDKHAGALGLSSGVYFYQLRAGDNIVLTRKMTLIK